MNKTTKCKKFIIVPATGTRPSEVIFNKVNIVIERSGYLDEIIRNSASFNESSRMTEIYENHENSIKYLADYIKESDSVNPKEDVFDNKSKYTMPFMKNIQQLILKTLK